MVCTDEQKADIYREYHTKVLHYIRSKIYNETVAEDLCSDVFLKVYSKLDTFDETKASISTWIYTITRNKVTDFFRTNRSFDEIPETYASKDSIEDEYCNKENLETLADALESLEERERNLVILHYYKGMTLKEAAEKLDISYSYAKIIHNKALKQLEKFF